MTAPPTLREIFTSPRETLWWSVSVLLVAWALVYGAGYVRFGGDAAGPAYYVIAQSIGVRADNVTTMVFGFVLVALLAARSNLTAVVQFVFACWCAWNAWAMFAGWHVTGRGYGGWPTWSFFTLLALLLYVASPTSMRCVPGHHRPARRRLALSDTPTSRGTGTGAA